MIDRDFTALRAVAEESALWRATCAIGSTLQVSWANSRVAVAVSRAAASIAATSNAGRIRAGATTIAWAAAAYGAGLAMAPPYVRPGIPVPVILAMAAIAFIASMSAEGLAKSWQHSWLRANLKVRPHPYRNAP